MTIEQSFRAAGRALRRPADLLPFYVLGGAVGNVGRSFVLVGLAIAYAFLFQTGRLETFVAELEALDQPIPGPDSNPEEVTAWSDELAAVVEQVFTPEVFAVLLVSVALFVLVTILLTPIVTAGRLGACAGHLRGERGLVGGIAAVRDRGLTVLGLYILEPILLIIGGLVLSAVGGVVGYVVGRFIISSSEPLTLAGIFAGVALLVWPFFAIYVRAVFAFAPVAAVVDDAGAFGAVSSAAGFVRQNLLSTLVYFVVWFGATILLLVAAAVFFYIEITTIPVLLVLLVVTPLLELFKTSLFADWRDVLNPPPAPAGGLLPQFLAGIRRGRRELVRFVAQKPGLVATSLAIGLAGFAMGWVGAEPFVGVVPTSIASRIEGIFPPTFAAELFGNNWTVALLIAFSGVFLVIPAIVHIWFNGVNIGMLGHLETEPLELLAFVIPHGIFEIPAIIVAGAVGIHLGLVSWGAFRGRLDREAFADELEDAFHVLVGLGLVLVLAALIEGFVSPYYWQYFL